VLSYGTGPSPIVVCGAGIGHPLLDTGPGVVSQRSTSSVTPSPSVSTGGAGSHRAETHNVRD
jgi:hypothetical protein